jgi:hypothetical protein
MASWEKCSTLALTIKDLMANPLNGNVTIDFNSINSKLKADETNRPHWGTQTILNQFPHAFVANN